MAQDLRAAHYLQAESNHSFEPANAANLPLSSHSVDAILTSPPYLSRIDYVRATLPELIALGYDDPAMVSELRRRMMGGVLSREPNGEERDRLPASVRRCLRRIEQHGSKASRTYYHRLARSFFGDLDAGISEALRVLKPGGRAWYVVQTSYYKDQHIDVPKLLVDIAKARGASSTIIKSESVSQHLGRMSPHQRKYVARKQLQEAVVEVRAAA